MILLDGRLLQFVQQFAQAVLPLLDRTARRRDVQFFDFDARGEFLQTRFEPRAFFFKLHFFGGKFFEPDRVALLLQIERGDFVADARQILRGGKRSGLRVAQILLQPFQIIFNLRQRELFFLKRKFVFCERIFRFG